MHLIAHALLPAVLAQATIGDGFIAMWNRLVAFLPNLLAALLILVLGIFLAFVLAAASRWLLARTTLDTRIARFITGGAPGHEHASERLVSRVVFWLVILFVLLAFFQTLQLAAITVPLVQLLNVVMGFLPRLIAALFLLLIAWAIASGLRLLVTSALARTQLDEKIERELEKERLAAPPPPARAAPPPARRPLNLARTLGDVVYWVVFLLFLPMILDALALEGVLGPVTGVLNRIFLFLPNLLVAALILVIGYFVANVIRRIAAGALASFGADQLGERVGLWGAGRRYRLSDVLAYVIFALILIPVVIAALNALQLEAITRPAERMLGEFLAAIPNIFAAMLLLLIAYFAGRLIAGILTNLLAAMGFDAFLERMGITRELFIAAVPVAPGIQPPPAMSPTPGTEGATPAGEIPGPAGAPGGTPAPPPRLGASSLIGTVVLVAIMLFATQEALTLLGFTALADLVHRFLVFLGNVVIGLIVIGLGFFLANLAARLIRDSAVANAGLLALAAKITIIVLAVAMGVEQMGVGQDVLRTVVAVLIAGIALAVGLAFGLGGRDVADSYLRKWRDRAENLPR